MIIKFDNILLFHDSILELTIEKDLLDVVKHLVNQSIISKRKFGVGSLTYPKMEIIPLKRENKFYYSHYLHLPEVQKELIQNKKVKIENKYLIDLKYVERLDIDNIIVKHLFES